MFRLNVGVSKILNVFIFYFFYVFGSAHQDCIYLIFCNIYVCMYLLSLLNNLMSLKNKTLTFLINAF